MENQPIQAHNLKAAQTWGSGGRQYDKISESIGDAIEHCVVRLAPKPGEQILDVATGTGRGARRIAARGARVTGIDMSADLIEAAKARAAEEGLTIDFKVGDAEALPVADASFDGVISTFGVMFVSKPEAAAAELARVCKPGGRLALTTWLPDSTIAGLFGVMRPYMPAAPSPPPPSPFAWGARERLQELLGRAFDLKFEPGVTVMREPSGEAAWDLFVNGYGPTKALANALDPDRRASLKKDFIAFHEINMSDLGVAMPRTYLVTIGVRR